ncbi:uncharacterized protein LOC136019575 [Lathamus discolor]|uniref:uncharacterized protein LOC136019575 n=1 Tax=Lathamus discolor TaxID=678569 RepID=UPI0032B763CD
MVEFEIPRTVRRACSKLTALDFTTADFGLFRNLLRRAAPAPLALTRSGNSQGYKWPGRVQETSSLIRCSRGCGRSSRRGKTGWNGLRRGGKIRGAGGSWSRRAAACRVLVPWLSLPSPPEPACLHPVPVTTNGDSSDIINGTGRWLCRRYDDHHLLFYCMMIMLPKRVFAGCPVYKSYTGFSGYLELRPLEPCFPQELNKDDNVFLNSVLTMRCFIIKCFKFSLSKSFAASSLEP